MANMELLGLCYFAHYFVAKKYVIHLSLALFSDMEVVKHGVAKSFQFMKSIAKSVAIVFYFAPPGYRIFKKTNGML